MTPQLPPRLTSPLLWIAYIVVALLCSVPRYLLLVAEVRESTRTELTALLGDAARADTLAVASVGGVAALFALILVVVACAGSALERRYTVRRWGGSRWSFGTGFLGAVLMTLPVQLGAAATGQSSVPAIGMVAVLGIAAVLPLLLRGQPRAGAYAVTLTLGVLLCLQ